MINILNKVDCCGCNACGDACSHGAISFKIDNEGFWYPEVDSHKCNDCHLCEKVCPVLNVEELKYNDFSEPICYAAQTKNLESLFNSTSGSAFATLAERMYKIGGYVGGAIFNEDYSVSQFISSDKADLEKIRNSKYAQSNSEGFFIKVRDLLKGGEKVLVCGLPCQMAGLRSFLRKDYENLIIVDLICLGINSPKILRSYLDYKEKQHGSKIVYYKAKNKEMGWRELTTKLVFENGEVEYDIKETNPFTQGFISTHAFSRPSCYECKFKGMPRIADITIGDLWGAERIVGKDYDHDLGTSVIMINSNKGMSFYESTKSFFKETDVKYEEVLRGNKALITPLSKPNFNRDTFYNDLQNLPFEVFASKYIKLPCNNTAINTKGKLKNIVRFFLNVKSVSGLSIKTWWQNIYYNLLSKEIDADIKNRRYILFNKYSIVDIKSGANVYVDGILRFGNKKVKGSRLESRLLVEKNGRLHVSEGIILYGADIEVFSDANLNLGRKIVFNASSTIICGGSIKIDDNVCFGRNVTVRDNNGGHFISRRTYKDKRAVVVGQHSWICEHAMLMPGAKLGTGVIVGANSVVSTKISSFSLCSGAPAEVVDENIFWKK